MKVSVFGGSQPMEGDPDYLVAYELGCLLAKSGHTVLTGGYIGTMEAVSRGANEFGGHVIGVTCSEIEKWRAIKPNEWISEERRYITLQERLTELIFACDAALALPGGSGTLTEIALAWNLMVIQALPVKPLILIGSKWKSFMDYFQTTFSYYIPRDQTNLILFVNDIREAVKRIDATIKVS